MVSSHIVSFIKRNPLAFNGFTGGLLCGASDIVAQQLEHYNANLPSEDFSRKARPYLASSCQEDSSLDWARFLCAGAIGIFFGGLVYPWAYAKLDKTWAGRSVSTVVQKSLVEIGTVGIFVNSVSMGCRGLLRGDKESTEVFRHVAKELPVVTRNDFFVWFPYNLLVFSTIPVFLRPTTTAMMEASWQTYISFKAHDYTKGTKGTQ